MSEPHAPRELDNLWVALAPGPDPEAGPELGPQGETASGDTPAQVGGLVVVDSDVDVGALIARLATAELTSLEIRFCGTPGDATS